jgi:hypothetical protein
MYRLANRHPWAVLAVVLTVLLIAFAFGYFSSAGGEPKRAAITVPPSKFDERLAQLDREAVENAYRIKIEQLISVWLRDESDQPRRAINGATQARKAFIGAMNEIERREKELK